uniref:C-type lectin domain-containing protein n=1 Tax=Panagrolaimus sp. PS1159 TaxID=55785 RepID=A0AC35FNV0_9BILA
MRLLLIFSALSVTVNGWGTSESYLNDKCHSYSGLSHFDAKTGICYILDINEKHSKDSVNDKICKHLQGYDGKLTSKDAAQLLKDEGIINDKRQAFFKDGAVNSGNSDAGAAVCQYTDHFYCPSGYTLHGTYCQKFHSSASLYTAAESTCKSDKGSLAVPHDDLHAQKLATLAQSEGAEDFFYIGIRSLQGSTKFENSDNTPSDYFRFLPRDGGFLDDVGSRIKNLAVAGLALSSKSTNAEGLGTFGYMEAFDGANVKLPFICQIPAQHRYGSVVIPYSTLSS